MIDTNDLLFGRSAPAARFENPGDVVTGTITKLDSRQRHAYDPSAANSQGLPMWWGPNNKPVPAQDGGSMAPVLDPVIEIQTTEGDGGDDDGRRRVFVKGKSIRDALVSAVKAAGVTPARFELGGTLSVTFTKVGPKVKGQQPAKLYSATYAAPSGQAVIADDDDPFAPF